MTLFTIMIMLASLIAEITAGGIRLDTTQTQVTLPVLAAVIYSTGHRKRPMGDDSRQPIAGGDDNSTGYTGLSPPDVAIRTRAPPCSGISG